MTQAVIRASGRKVLSPDRNGSTRLLRARGAVKSPRGAACRPHVPPRAEKIPYPEKIKWLHLLNRAETIVWRGFQVDLNIVLDVKGC